MLPDDLFVALGATHDLLEKLNIPYYVGGSVASITYGSKRLTRDIDIAISLSARSVDEFVEAFAKDFYVEPVSVLRSIETSDCFNVIHIKAMFQVDVFTPKPSEWVDLQFDRRVPYRFGEGERWVDTYLCSPEDVILNKLMWYDLGNRASRYQWDDALGVFEIQRRTLDCDYLSHWAETLGIQQLYRELLDTAPT